MFGFVEVGVDRSLRLGVGFQAEGEADFGAAVFARASPNVATLRFDEALADGEADACTGGFLRRAAGSVKGGENETGFFRFDPAAAVEDADGDLAVLAGGCHLDRPAGWTVLLGVVEKVRQYLLEVRRLGGGGRQAGRTVDR